ncbi:hypothetical protein B0H13DRAFT_2337393 [Mycena leptocephala]|nr:hypothetical protein B0H13DRAFT_2337393 [Mycena leptocephala]
MFFTTRPSRLDPALPTPFLGPPQTNITDNPTRAERPPPVPEPNSGRNNNRRNNRRTQDNANAPNAQSQPRQPRQPEGPADSSSSAPARRGRAAKFNTGLTSGDAGSSLPKRKPASVADDLTSILTAALGTPPYPDCPICFAVHPAQPTSSCAPSIPVLETQQYCWTTFHLKCIRSWATKSVKEVADAAPRRRPNFIPLLLRLDAVLRPRAHLHPALVRVLVHTREAHLLASLPAPLPPRAVPPPDGTKKVRARSLLTLPHNPPPLFFTLPFPLSPFPLPPPTPLADVFGEDADMWADYAQSHPHGEEMEGRGTTGLRLGEGGRRCRWSVVSEIGNLSPTNDPRRNADLRAMRLTTCVYDIRTLKFRVLFFFDLANPPFPGAFSCLNTEG